MLIVVVNSVKQGRAVSRHFDALSKAGPISTGGRVKNFAYFDRKNSEMSLKRKKTIKSKIFSTLYNF